MARIRMPTPLRTLTKGKDEVSVHGESVDEILKTLCSEYSGVRERIYDEEGRVRRFVNVFVNDQDIRNLDGLATPVRAYLVAFRPEARELVLSTFIEGVFSWMRDRMGLPRGVRAQGGSVTIVARAGGALNLNPHFHALILDGMFVEDPARREPRFVRMRHASEKDLRALEVSLAFRVF
ncbi:MAG: transposase, partial [Planctomycetes bacterium]|nr:transposase [Planctomycetota bacterium]